MSAYANERSHTPQLFTCSLSPVLPSRQALYYLMLSYWYITASREVTLLSFPHLTSSIILKSVVANIEKCDIWYEIRFPILAYVSGLLFNKTRNMLNLLIIDFLPYLNPSLSETASILA